MTGSSRHSGPSFLAAGHWPAKPRRLPLARWVLAVGCLVSVAGEAAAAGQDGAAVFARVGDVVIARQAYDQAYAVAARNKFYHGKPPEQEVARLQREVGDSLVTEVLLLKEARRRRLQPNHAAVAKEIDGYELRYRTSPMWLSNKATMLPPLKKRLEDNSLLDQLQAAVRHVPEPSERQVESYYEQHRDKFTEPEQVRLSVIVLKVDPSSPQAQWNAAFEEGAAITRRLRSGADFAALAHLHSGDSSAQQGGDMGYLHHGMLPEPAQLAIDKLANGAVSDPVALLEGVAVFRLEERKAAHLNPLATVKQRATDLLRRDLSEKAWSDLLLRLRHETPTQVDESGYLPLAIPVANAKPTGK